MGRRPKKFDVEPVGFEKLLREEKSAFLTSSYVPTLATRSVVRALLQHINLPKLNREVAEEEIITSLLHSNADLHFVRTYVPENNMPGKEKVLDWIKTLHGRSGFILVKRVLRSCCQHSLTRMRQESDEVLQALGDAPFHTSLAQRRRWLDANLPPILLKLKDKHRCYTECPAHTAWPPKESEEKESIVEPPAINNPVAMKNAILAYFHGLKPLTIRHYLEGRRLKGPSRPR